MTPTIRLPLGPRKHLAAEPCFVLLAVSWARAFACCRVLLLPSPLYIVAYMANLLMSAISEIGNSDPSYQPKLEPDSPRAYTRKNPIISCTILHVSTVCNARRRFRRIFCMFIFGHCAWSQPISAPQCCNNKSATPRVLLAAP